VGHPAGRYSAAQLGATMLYLVHMQVELPRNMPPQELDELKAREKAYSQAWQKQGSWQHLWRVAGEYANYSVFNVESNDRLHELLSGLPLFPYLRIKVTPLAQHPSSIR
jgi:muconolactone D-isomerase